MVSLVTNPAVDPNSSHFWERYRNLVEHEPVPEEPCPTYRFRMQTILSALVWIWNQRPPGATPAVLDVSAGNGLVATFAAEFVKDGVIENFQYAATEQSPALCALVRSNAGPAASIAVWRYEPGGVSLDEALSLAPDLFARQYQAVLASHLLEHVHDAYGLADQLWTKVAPGGWLLLCVPRHDEHRTHTGLWDYNRLVAFLRQYGVLGEPLAVWEYGPFADCLLAVRKADAAAALVQNGPVPVQQQTQAQAQQPPPPRPGDPPPVVKAPVSSAVDGSGATIQVAAHVDGRLRSDQPIGDYLTVKPR